MSCVIALVGRPNVGKSTLFNRITRTRDALVADIPGLTRDRLYGIGHSHGRRFIVIDTGGLDEAGDALHGKVQEQTHLAIAEADAVVLVTDARSGLAAQDQRIAEDLRRSGKPVVVAVNKCESLEPEVARAEFFGLGLGDPIPVAAAHGQGVDRLLETVLQPLPEPEPEPLPESVPVVAVVGRPNAGKSTLVNRLLGEERVVVSDQPGTTRDSIRLDLRRDGQRYVLIDTAGVRRRARIDDRLEKFSVVKSLQAIEHANVVIFLLDASREISAQDASLAGFVLDAGRSMVLAVNKWDGLSPSRRDRVRAEIGRRLPFLEFLQPHFISALHGSGVGDLFAAVDQAYASATATLATARLNRILGLALRATAPPMGRGRPIKLKFAHQAGHNPPLIRIYGNQVEQLPESYRRYLANRFRKALALTGTPVRVEFKSGENPYQDRSRGRRGTAAKGPQKRYRRR